MFVQRGEHGLLFANPALKVARVTPGGLSTSGEIVCAVTRFAAPTSIGNQNITTADLNGLTPKAVIFIGTRGVTDATVAAHTQMSFGAATGSTNEWCATSNSEDAQTTSDSASEIVNHACILFHTLGTTTAIAEADFTTFIADGCTINWSNVDSAFLITAVFFAGNNLSAHANNAALADTVNNAVDITDPGFEPDIVIATAFASLAINTGATSTRSSLGFCSNNGSGGIVQRSISSQFRNGKATTDNSQWTSDNCIVRGITDTGTSDWRGSLGTFDSSGFTCTTLDAGANSASLCYLALRFGGVAKSFVGTHTAPTATGNNSDTGPGFNPQLVIRLMTLVDTVNTQDSASDEAGTYGVSAMDADEAYSASVSDEDAVGTSNSQSLSDNVAMQLPEDNGGSGITASFVSFDANGWTENYTAVQATAGLIPALAIESI